MKYEELKEGDIIYYLNVTPEIAKLIPHGKTKVEEAKVLSITRPSDNYIVDTDALGEIEITPKEFFENESDTAYSETAAFILATTKEGFIAELKKLLFD